MKKKLLISSTVVLLFSNALAQDNNFSYFLVERELNVISATKEAVPYTSVPRYMKVVTREELDRWGVRNLFDLLKLFPEFRVRKSYFYLNALSAMGIRQSYFSEKVQVLIDGLPMMDPSTGSSFSTDNNFSLDNVKRVEIVFGPMTSLYGFNSSVAVINLITYSPEELSFKAGSHINTDGSNDSYFLKGFKKGSWSGLFSLDYTEEKGPYKEFKDSYGHETNFSVYNKHFTYYLKLKNENGFYANFWGVNRDTTFPVSISGFITNENHSFTDRTAYINKLGFKRDLSFGKLNVYGFYSYFYLKRGYNLCPSSYPLCASIQKDGLLATEKRYVNNYGSGAELSFGDLENRWTLGLELEVADMYKTELSANFLPSSVLPALASGDLTKIVTFPYRKLSDKDKLLDEARRTTFSPYVQYFVNREKYSLLFNLRWDKASDVGEAASYSVSGMYKLSKKVNFKLNVGKSVRVPSFEEMHIKNNPVLFGNDNLKFEKVYSFMPSFEFAGDSLKVSCLYYFMLVKDMIYKEKLSPITSMWKNADGSVKISGSTFSVRKRMGDSEVYSKVGRRFSFRGLSGTSFEKFPKWKGVFGYSYLGDYFTFDLNSQAYSKVDKSPGYYVINAALTLKPIDNLKTVLRVDNLFNRKGYYSTSYGTIRGEGRTLWIGVEYAF